MKNVLDFKLDLKPTIIFLELIVKKMLTNIKIQNIVG